MVFYTLVISLFNLALGYFLALFLQSRGISPGSLRPDFLARLNLPRFGRARPIGITGAPGATGSASPPGRVDSAPPALAQPVANNEAELVSAK